jgi:outer membrane lipoprotein-sorting protein
MFRKAFLCLLPLVLCGGAIAQDAPSVDDLVAKNTAAMGGAEKRKAIQSTKISATMNAANGMQLPLTIYAKRPGMMRTEMNVQDMNVVTAFDGTTAWTINPMMGSNEPTVQGEAETKSVRASAETFLDGSLMDYKAKGKKVEYAGKEDVKGSPAYKLIVTDKSGTAATVYLDAKSYLEVRSIRKVTQMGQEIEVDSYPADYRPEAGALMPHSIETGMAGMMMKMTIDKIEVNAPVEDSLFKMPAKPDTKKQ